MIIKAQGIQISLIKVRSTARQPARPSVTALIKKQVYII